MKTAAPDESLGSVEVVLGLGANIGDAAGNLLEGFERISSGILSDAVLSSLYVTEPQDVTDQPEFINAACCGFYIGSAVSLLKAVHSVEIELGRQRNREQRRGPRLIDIDILYFGGYVISWGRETDGECRWLRIPHERLNIRKFELVPLLELKPELTDPMTGEPYSHINSRLSGQGIYSFDAVRYIKDHGAERGR